jgi:putative phosphoesterase
VPGDAVRLAILADTHMPRGARRLPERCIELCRGADVILHAGDFMEASVLEELQALGPVAGVHGNVDSRELRSVLPGSLVLEAGEATIAMVHDAGPRRGRLERLRARFPEADAVVFGHSHMPLHEARDGFQIFNPGSPTERRRSRSHTMGLARASGGEVTFELVELS